jgi:Rieske Fe-S protein
MAQCRQCGNDYDKAFEVIMGGQNYVFDSFECAIATLAPTCRHCGCRIIGHGTEVNGVFYCCANCASTEGVAGLRDRG